jgi:thiol-disulfide isomerase/thioredoxin
MKGKYVIGFVFLIMGFLFVSGCTSETESTSQGDTHSPASDADWRNLEMKDVNSGEMFKIADFAGTPVLVESFAVWCPLCTRQQSNIKSLHEEVGDSIISISLDTDPNEDESLVTEHTQKNGFDWRYAIAPVAVTKSLIDDFGVGVVNAPAVPVILICEDQSARMLERGVKSVDDLKAELARGC